MKTFWKFRRIAILERPYLAEDWERRYSWKIKDYPTLVAIDPIYISEIDNPSEEVQLIVVNRDSGLIEFIKNPTEKVQLIAVKEYPLRIRQIKNPTDKVKLAAVSIWGSVIQYIDNPSEEMKIAAVRSDASSIIHIKNPSQKVQLQAVAISADAYYHLKSEYTLSDDVVLEAIKTNPEILLDLDNPPDEFIIAAIWAKPLIFYRIFRKEWELSEDVIMVAVDADSSNYDFLEKNNYPIPDRVRALARRKYGYLS